MNQTYDAIVIGGGLSGLTAAATLSRGGLRIALLEQNRLPGGCAGSFYRQGARFDAGATTLIGFEPGLPLDALQNELQLDLPLIDIDPAMSIVLADGRRLSLWRDERRWIEEVQSACGSTAIAGFWQECLAIAELAWDLSARQRRFPPADLADLLYALKQTRAADLRILPYLTMSVRGLLRKHGLHEHSHFVRIIDNLLMITAQNRHDRVSAAFGAAALGYGQRRNSYLIGGIGRLADALAAAFVRLGGDLHYRQRVQFLGRERNGSFVVRSDRGDFRARAVVNATPLWNLFDLADYRALGRWRRRQLRARLPQARELVSAFSLGIVFRRERMQEVVHHQIHFPAPIEALPADSCFLSFSHPADQERAPAGLAVASVSMHLHDPASLGEVPVERWKESIVDLLDRRGLIAQESIEYLHINTHRTWQDWTLRKYGAVGGTPQDLSRPPWRWPPHRLRRGLYQCGDSVYPGQGAAAVCLSGMFAAERLLHDEHAR